MKTQTAAEIKTELDAANKRISELTELRKTAAGNVEDSQSNFIKSKIPLDQLQAEQSKLDLLDNSIKSLQTRQSELHTELQSAAKSEAHKDTLARLKGTANEAETAYNEYVAYRAEFDKVIALHSKKVFGAIETFRGKQREFRGIFAEIVPGILSVRRPEVSQRAIVAQTAAELEEIGISENSFKLAIEDYLQLPVLENAEIISFAQTNASNRKHTEQQEQRQKVSRANG